MAGVGEGIYKNLDDAEKVHSVKEIVEPAAGSHEKYQKIKRIYDKLYYDLKDTFEMSAE